MHRRGSTTNGGADTPAWSSGAVAQQAGGPPRHPTAVRGAAAGAAAHPAGGAAVPREATPTRPGLRGGGAGGVSRLVELRSGYFC